jgi:hypothetical protein
MLDIDKGINARIQLSKEVDEDGDELLLIIFKAEDEIEKEMNFGKNSYLFRGENENVIISHVINYEESKTLVKEEGKKTYAIIFNTHIYIKKGDESIRRCFQIYANAIKNKNDWIRIPDHDKANL